MEPRQIYEISTSSSPTLQPKDVHCWTKASPKDWFLFDWNLDCTAVSPGVPSWHWSVKFSLQKRHYVSVTIGLEIETYPVAVGVRRRDVISPTLLSAALENVSKVLTLLGRAKRFGSEEIVTFPVHFSYRSLRGDERRRESSKLLGDMWSAALRQSRGVDPCPTVKFMTLRNKH